MNSRRTAREGLVSLLNTVGTFVAVYDREVFDFQRLSPVAMVHSDGTAPGFDSLSSFHRQQALIISIWWKRTEATEDNIDDLSEDVIDLLEANAGLTASWEGLQIDETFSFLDYPILDGVQYRRERIRVIIW